MIRPIPASKDPSEGPRGPARGGDPSGSPEDGNLGAGGDPAEGKPDLKETDG